jgi:hypothetical protein
MMHETKQEILDRLLAMKKPLCPHCNRKMSIWEDPMIGSGDGLGWGVPYLFICFNDQCSMYRTGWDDMMNQTGHYASYRCMNYPGTDQFECIPVFGETGGKGQIIDEQVLTEQEIFKEKMKSGFSILADCYVNEDVVKMLSMLSDGSEPVRVRLKAAEMIGDVADTEAIEPLRHLKLGNEKLIQMVNEAIVKIHTKYFTRECPFCAEIIKQRANICKHCGKEVVNL